MRKNGLIALLAFGGIFYFSIAAAATFEGVSGPPDDLWIDGYYHQANVETPESGSKVIHALVEGRWQEFSIVEFPKIFMDWNKTRRLQTLDEMSSRNSLNREPSLSGPHDGMVATYGAKRTDSQFSLNNAVKGIGFLPKRTKIKETIKLLRDRQNSPIQEKIRILRDFYENMETLFDLDKQVSLELYSQPKFVTQTFINQAANPVSTIVFLDIPTFKLKAITQLLDSNDPQLSEYERDVVDYVNVVHSFFHGSFPRNFIVAIYYAIEVYDSTPGHPEGMGRRIAPPMSK